MEAELDGIEWRSAVRLNTAFQAYYVLIVSWQIAHRSLPNHGIAPIQASTHVHPRRSRRRPRSFTHAEYWPVDQDEIQRIAIHCCQFEGWHVPECKSDIQDEVQRGHECSTGTDACRSKVGVAQGFCIGTCTARRCRWRNDGREDQGSMLDWMLSVLAV